MPKWFWPVFTVGFAVCFTLIQSGVSFWYIALGVLGPIIVWITWDNVRNPRPLRRPDKRSRLISNGRNPPLPEIEGFELRNRLRYTADGQCFAVLINHGKKPISLPPANLSLVYTNVLGNPALGGNSVDGVLLEPAPVMPTLAPDEMIEVLVFGPDRPLRVMDLEYRPHNQQVVDDIKAAGTLMDFLRHDTSRAFYIELHIGSGRYGASLEASRIKP